MSEEKKNHRFDPAGEPPIPVPPVEEAWPLMQQKLDVFMPSLPWYKNFQGWHLFTAASVSAVVIASLFIGISRYNDGHHKSANSVTNSPSASHDSLSQDTRNTQHLQHLQGTQNIKDTQNIQGIRNIQSIQNIQASPDLQNIQNTQDKPDRQSAQKTQNTEGIRNVEHTNNTENTLNEGNTSSTHTQADPNKNIPFNKSVAGDKELPDDKELPGIKELAGNRYAHPNKDKPAGLSTPVSDNKTPRVTEGIVFSHPNHGMRNHSRGNPQRYRQFPSVHHSKDTGDDTRDSYAPGKKSSGQVDVSATNVPPANASSIKASPINTTPINTTSINSSPGHVTSVNSSLTKGTDGQKGLRHQRNSPGGRDPREQMGSHKTTAHPSLVYTAFTLEKVGVGFSGNSQKINDSVLKNIRLPRKKLVAGNTPAGYQKTNAGQQKKPVAKKEQGTFMSAGLSIAKSFPIGKQESVPYNANAGSNRLTDYIPAPYFRFDINNRIYLEAAFQFSSPQYTPSQLIDSTSDSVALVGSGPLLQLKTITLEKLYYTYIPLTIHYRLFGGLYLGAGLQFSKLWGAVASENGSLRPTNAPNNFVDSARTSSVFSLKNNSKVYGKLKKDDWRILLEASYTWKRFSLGLRYQQALSPYLPVLPDGSKGKDKNSSLTLHLDYDLWKQQRKK